MEIEARAGDSADVAVLVGAQQAEIAARYAPEEEAGGFPMDPTARFLVGFLDGVPVGCGAIQTLEPGVAEVKRMYVRPDHRGRGLSRRLLATLEDAARAEGHTEIRLETGTRQGEAIGLYTSAGYGEIPLFGHYVGSETSRCFGKVL
ncbi:N-acetyltransferase [Longispora fulva]|uniref:GNAT superfamily N-acetyltransferase n=1 Tax=Longispora fulva TaxID=619741 RepID=A0A8J7GVY6_9ACTN|nr:GNAT family N-acetyltransferase [Longispora fulva]MBG6139604.1 GNAT superfamily N-acetyltransferase [Longispora fulva]GIG58013.1 N-acetyltransferase [Longispora fulva]